MKELFENYATVLIFLHILSAVIWVGGMIAIKFAVHPSIQAIEDPKVKLGKTLQVVGRLFYLVMPFIFISFLCALILTKGIGYTGVLIHIKEAIWTIMTLNFIYMYILRAKAQNLYETGDFTKAKTTVRLLPNVLLPINIILGLVAIFMGVVIRGF